MAPSTAGKRDNRLSAIVDEIQKTLPKTEAEIPEAEVEQADHDIESDEKYSVREDMTEEERYEELKNRQFLAVDSSDISEYYGSLVSIER